jgi:hypothetical protein
MELDLRVPLMWGDKGREEATMPRGR